jgi:hypothetical protein
VNNEHSDLIAQYYQYLKEPLTQPDQCYTIGSAQIWSYSTFARRNNTPPIATSDTDQLEHPLRYSTHQRPNVNKRQNSNNHDHRSAPRVFGTSFPAYMLPLTPRQSFVFAITPRGRISGQMKGKNLPKSVGAGRPGTATPPTTNTVG